MYKIVTVLLMLVSTSVFAASCASGKGEEFVGVNGTKYCMSPMGLKWWSAFAWCDTIGMKLIDLNDECECDGFDGCDNTLKCPNLKQNNGNFAFWTTGTSGSTANEKNKQAYYIASGGNIATLIKINSYSCRALCKK